MLHQKVLFSKEESLTIRSFVNNLEDRVIGTYHPDINQGEHDPNGGHNLAEHLPWSSSKEYDWVYKRIIDWIGELNLPINNLGWELIVQKYLVGFEFKPHIDDVLGPNKTMLRKRYYTILIQLSESSEYEGGELWVRDDNDYKINQQVGNVSIFDSERIHWVTKITEGERWSCTIFLEKDALKRMLI
jgi:hypothetical protein